MLCACGCGSELREARYPSQQPRFIRNHHRPRLGTTHSDETKRKISATKLSDDPGYFAIHVWMLKWFPKTGICEECGRDVGSKGASGTQWANISGEYHRDRSDFREMCRSCHRLFDNARRQ